MPDGKKELLGDLEYRITIHDRSQRTEDVTIKGFLGSSNGELNHSGSYDFLLVDTIHSTHDIDISVYIWYSVDFSKRNFQKDYIRALKESGVTIQDLRIENGFTEDQSSNMLTFGDYLNEDGIDDETRANRYNEFWRVSNYKNDVMYQTVVESPLKNMTTGGIVFKNNYSSGDLYGDLFVTKSMLDPRYDMLLDKFNWNNISNSWENGEMDDVTEMLRAETREYIGIGQCSNQLALFYKPIDTAIGCKEQWKDIDGDGELDSDDRVMSKRNLPERDSRLKYQMVETVKNINRFESHVKHKSNVFSVIVQNSNLASDKSVDMSLGNDSP